jgi:pyruvate ferredoxin oxidoreductase gamma subunit
MPDLWEIRWHGRGGQGAVTAAKFLAEVALSKDFYFQAFPEYGAERMGAPIQAFTRLSNSPIYIRSAIEKPNVIVVLDPTLIGSVNILEGARSDTVILVNTPLSPAEIKKMLNLEDKKNRVLTVDATKIALETIGRPIPNTPLVGALVKATGLFTLEEVIESLRASFGKKFSDEVVEGNITAVKRAYEEVKEA